MNQAINKRVACLNLVAVLAILAMLTLSGCAATSPQFEKQFGDSVRAAVSSQTVDPGAARNTSVVSGMDGTAARATYLGYQGSYHTPAAAAPSMVGANGK